MQMYLLGILDADIKFTETCRLGGVMVTFSPPTQQTGVRFPAAAGRPVTRLYLVQLRLEMHTPWFVGLTPYS